MWGIYQALLKQAYVSQAQYRVGSLIWIGGMVVEPLIYMIVWRTIGAAQAGSIGSYSINDISAYYIAFLFVRQLVASPSFYLYERRIHEGTLSYMLLRPLHPLHGDIAEEAAYKIMILVIITPILAALMWVFQINLSLTLPSMLLFVLSLVLAAMLRFSMQWMLALLCFWTTRLSAVHKLYFMLQTFLGGTLAPIDLLPDGLEIVARALPFAWIFTFPINLLLGRLSSAEIMTGFVAQSLWLLVVVVAMLMLWRAGIRRFAAVGG